MAVVPCGIPCGFLRDAEAMTSVEFKAAGHAEHDMRWSFARAGQPPVCIACLSELLDCQNELSVKKKLVISQLTDVFHNNKVDFIRSLKEEICVAAHITLTLLGLCYESEHLSILSVEVLFSMLTALQTEELLGFVVDNISSQVLKLCNYKKCLGVLNLLGRLLHNVSPLTLYVLHNHGSLVDFVCGGLSYPDPPVQCSLCYICVELYERFGEEEEKIPTQTSEHVSQCVLQTLTNTSAKQGEQLLINMLGLLKTMLGHSRLADLYISQKQQLAGAVKKVLLSRVVVVQIGGVQSLVTLLRQDKVTEQRSYARSMLEEDMAEFLFEALYTSSDLLIGSVLGCLLLFSESEVFFHKCHAVYGIEAVVHSLEHAQKLKNADLLNLGLNLLAVILRRHTGSIRLFSGSTLLRQCVLVLSGTVRHHKAQLALSAAECLLYLLRKDYMTAPTPFNDIADAVKHLASKVREQLSVTSQKPGPTVADYSLEDSQSQVGRSQHRNINEESEPMMMRSRKELGVNTRVVTATTAEMWLARLLGVVDKALELGESLSSDPVADEQSYTCPDNSQATGAKLSSAQSFVLSSLDIVDKTCIPAVLEHTGLLEDPPVFVHLFSVLRKVLHLCRDNVHVLSRRLAAMGFISLGLQAKVKNSDESVKHEVNHFLIELLNHLVADDLVNDDNPGCLSNALSSGIQQLSGDMNTVLYVLETALRQDNLDWNIVCSAVCIIYFTVLFYPRVFEDVSVHPAWCSLICRTFNASCSSYLPAPVLRQVVYVFVVSEQRWNSSDGLPHASEAQKLLLEFVTNSKTPQDWCLLNPEILEWCFSSDQITDCCGLKMLEYHFSSGKTCCDDKLAEIIFSHTALAKTLLVLLSSECAPEVPEKASGLLQKLLTKETWKEACPEVQVCIKSYLPEFTLRVFLQCDQALVRDHCLALSMKLLTALKLLTLHDPLTASDTKLLIQVCKWLSCSSRQSEEKNDTDTSEVAWMFVSTALLHGKLQGDDRVCSIFLKHQNLLDLLLNNLQQNRDICQRDVIILSLLIDDVKDKSVSVTLPLEKLMHLLLSSSQPLRGAGLLFWVTYLNCSDSEQVSPSPTIRWQRSDSQGLCVTEGCEIQGGLSDKDWRLFYIYIQQCIVQEHTGIQDLAVVCMRRLFSCVAVNTNIYKHLKGQPWNSMVLQVLHEQFRSETESHTLVFIHLLRMMVKHNMPCVLRYIPWLVDDLKSKDKLNSMLDNGNASEDLFSSLQLLYQDLQESSLEVAESVRGSLCEVVSYMTDAHSGESPALNSTHEVEIIVKQLTDLF